ncbi:MAG: sensor histidine kinase [Lachnospiraceae bacterium]|nr:sensor histidine kinase [Lachnospiraceae bacterium]
MLGGSFLVSFLRNGIGAGLMMTVFLLLDHPKLPMKKAIWCYMAYGAVVSTAFGVWYVVNSESYIRFSGISAIFACGIFCTLMSDETIYLSLYRVALGFYLLSVTVFCGIDTARMWFAGNMWVDIGMRLLLTAVSILFIAKKIRKRFWEGIDFLREEMDLFSAAALLVSVLCASLMVYLPDKHPFSVTNAVRIMILLFMAGLIQYMIFQIYLQRGKAHRYQVEKELLEMNEQLLHRQIELVRESEVEAARIRHDIRHNCLLMEEYIKNADIDKLLAYVKQYGEEMENRKTERICRNDTINGILSAYARKAGELEIPVDLHVKIEDNIAIRDIDLVAILANVFENAINGCMRSGDQDRLIQLSITQRENKIAVQCKNTCAPDVKFHKGMPKSNTGGGMGARSIVKVASYYNGEADFAAEGNLFITRILLNLPSGQK